MNYYIITYYILILYYDVITYYIILLLLVILLYYNFHAKVKVGVLQLKDLKLVMPEYYIFMKSNSFFIALGIS